MSFSYSSIAKRGLEGTLQQPAPKPKPKPKPKVPTLKVMPEPVKVAKPSVDRLGLVLDAAKARQDSNRLPPKVNLDGYEPQYGMTCVMNPTEETIKVFGKPFYDRIMADPKVKYVFFPVDPEGFHVTLLGLEYSKLQISGKSNEEIRSELRNAQRYLNKTVPGPVVFDVSINDNRPGLVVYPRDVVDDIRAAEEKLKTKLEVNRKHPQNWHVTLGYFRPQISDEDKRVAFFRLKHHARKVLDEISPHTPFLSFNGPQVCVYRDHTKYYPLFK